MFQGRVNQRNSARDRKVFFVVSQNILQPQMFLRALPLERAAGWPTPGGGAWACHSSHERSKLIYKYTCIFENQTVSTVSDT